MSAAGLRTDPSDEELANVSLACEHLWTLDGNRMTPDKDYALNLQGAVRTTRFFPTMEKPGQLLGTGKISEEPFKVVASKSKE